MKNLLISQLMPSIPKYKNTTESVTSDHGIKLTLR